MRMPTSGRFWFSLKYLMNADGAAVFMLVKMGVLTLVNGTRPYLF